MGGGDTDSSSPSKPVHEQGIQMSYNEIHLLCLNNGIDLR